ncbi:hypothetical protein [Ferruginibacter sp.]
MTRYCTIIIAVIFFTACRSQPVHSDCGEYGYIGKIKQIRKTTFSNIVAADTNRISKDSKGELTEIYYADRNGNFDSLFTERAISEEDTLSYKRKFRFENPKRRSWEAYDMANRVLMSGSIDWLTDKKYDEKVFYPGGGLKYETITSLNEKFRIFKILVKGYDPSGNVTQNSMQEFYFFDSGDINYITTTDLDLNKTEMRTYEYLHKDRIGNPTEVLITKPNSKSKSLLRIEYEYYE